MLTTEQLLVVLVALESMFLNPGGLTFLSFLVPLLLLYLIKPKPQRRTIPSLMFILKDTGRNRLNRMFRNFMTDVLIFFHILAVLLLAGSIAQPFINLPQSMLVDDSILVIDVSASTKVDERFEDIRAAALDHLAERNTVILAQRVPEQIADRAPAATARQLIRNLEPKDTTTNLADALKIAADKAGPGTNVIVISDFLPSEGDLDIQPQLDALESKGALVTPIIVGERRENIGIIDLAVRDDESRVWVKNFADAPRDVTLRIGEVEQDFVLGKKETREVSFQTPAGVTEISIAQDDALKSDNKAWISTPTDNQISMLVFTNDKAAFEKSRIKLAFDLIDKNFPVNIEYTYAVPPKIPDLEHDVYLFHKINPDFLLPGVVKQLSERVQDGAALLITAQDNVFAIDFRGMLPVDYVDKGGAAEVISPTRNVLTKDISFGQVQSYLRTTAKEGTTVVAAAGEDPLITISKLGQGTIVWYGYTEGQESFSSDNSFPVFWRRVLDLVTNRPSIQNLNVRTGTVLSFPNEERITTPTGKIKTRLLRADDGGLYVLEDRTIVANMLSDLESNVDRDPVIDQTEGGAGEQSEKKAPKDLSQLFILIGLIVLFLELIYVKLRGDL